MPAACSSTHSYSSHVSFGAEREQVRARCSCRQERSQLLAVPASHRGLVLHAEKQLPAPLPRCLQAFPTTGCSSNTLRIIHLMAVSQAALSIHTHTHTKYTMLPANILITTLNKRLIRSLKGIFLSVALCCCGNRIPRAYPEIRLLLRYWIILLTFRIGKAKIIPSKQADLWRSLIFSFSLHLA